MSPTALWLVATVMVALCVASAVVAGLRDRPAFAIPALIPAAVGLFVRATYREVSLPRRNWIIALSLAMVALAIVAGSALTTLVLGLTDRNRPAEPDQAEILRGGATIGYLERIAVVAAVALGRLEIVAAVIAIKGLGRFSELSTPAARERFIIGTLVSLMWAGLVAGLVWPPH